MGLGAVGARLPPRFGLTVSTDGVGAVFVALADPNRRTLVQLLAARETATATELTEELPVSRQAIAKHLAVLRRARLVMHRRAGRETRYRLSPEPLAEAMSWMAAVGAQWDERLERLRDHLLSQRGDVETE